MRSHIKITQMKVMSTDQHHQAVVHVEWAKAVITDDGIKASIRQTSDFDPEKITGHFVPFEELTEALVLTWIMKDYEEHKDMIEKSISGQIDAARKAKAMQRVDLPWVSA